MKRTVAAIFAVSILGAALFLAHAYKTRGDRPGNISVTGLGSIEFESDEISWTGTVTVTNSSMKEGFEKVALNSKMVQQYLIRAGLDSSEFSLTQVNTEERSRGVYNEEGNYIGSKFLDYELTQSIQVYSKKLDLVEKIAREITELLNIGIAITSRNPKYYYSDLDKLKLNLIEQASENGRIRAEQIAGNSGSKLTGLNNARLGVFQILGKNSGESYSWSGTFNTSSRMKEASITVKMDFDVE